MDAMVARPLRRMREIVTPMIFMRRVMGDPQFSAESLDSALKRFMSRMES